MGEDFSSQLSAFSSQLSAFSFQLLAISYQPSAIGPRIVDLGFFLASETSDRSVSGSSVFSF
jgi:hypothetical protein